MTRPILAAAAFGFLAAPAAAFAQPADPPAPASALHADGVPVRLQTGLGPIVILLDTERAPLTSANFLRYVDSHKFDGESFYRAMPYGDGGLIQGGITSSARKLGPPVAFESTDRTGLSNTAGTIAMAALEPGQAQADFFIMTTDIKAFDGPKGFAAFGKVIAGMDVVKAILAAPVSPTRGEGAMKGQMLEPAVKIVSAERIKG